MANCIRVISVCLLAAVIGCSRPQQQPGFVDAGAMVRSVFPETGVTIDTIATASNIAEFEYKGDSIQLHKLFVPLFPEYEEPDSGIYEAIVDTPLLRYGAKEWQLPVSLQKLRLTIEALLHITTKSKKYIGLVLVNPLAMGTLASKCTIVLIDISNPNAVQLLDTDLQYDIPYFIDYETDGALEVFVLKAEGWAGNSQYINQQYSLTLCKPLPYPEPVYAKNNPGSPVGIHFYDSARRYIITRAIK